MLRGLVILLCGSAVVAHASDLSEKDFVARVRCQQNLQGPDHAASEAFRTDLQNALVVQKDLLVTARITLTQHLRRSLEDRPKLSKDLSSALQAESWPPNAHQIIKADPYVAWLETQGKPVAETLERDSDPKSPRYLSPELSYVRLVRDFDPNLTPEQRLMAQDVFKFLAQENFIASHLMDQFSARNHPLTPNGSWDLALNLKEARQNYQRLMDLQQRRYGHIFSLIKFEELRALVQDPAAQMDIMRISDSPMFQGMESNALTYPFFLVRNFGDDSREHTMQTMRGLRLILEVGEAVHDQVAFGDYLEEMLRQHTSAPIRVPVKRALELHEIE